MLIPATNIGKHDDSKWSMTDGMTAQLQMNARTDELLRVFKLLYCILWEKIKTKLKHLSYLHTNNLTAVYFSTSIFHDYCSVC